MVERYMAEPIQLHSLQLGQMPFKAKITSNGFETGKLRLWDDKPNPRKAKLSEGRKGVKGKKHAKVRRKKQGRKGGES
jgi:hypothetical protein